MSRVRDMKDRGSYLEGVVKEGPSEEVTFELRYELSVENKMPGGGNSRCNGSKVGGMLCVTI